MTTTSNQVRATKRLLVVDDSKMVRQGLTMMLRSLGYRVSSVASGEEAIDYLQQARVDVVLLDMMLGPGMDGLDTYVRLLQLRTPPQVIIISADANPERLQQAQVLGAAYVEKPFDRQTIAAAIQTLLEV